MAVNDDHAELIEESIKKHGIIESTPIDPSSVQITQKHQDLFRDAAIELDKGFIKRCRLKHTTKTGKELKFTLNEQEIHLESGNPKPGPNQHRTTTFVGLNHSEIDTARESIHMVIVSLNSIFNEIHKTTDQTNIIVYKRFTFVSVDRVNDSGEVMFLIHYGIIHS